MERDEERLRKQKDFIIKMAYYALWIIPILIVIKMAGSVILPFAIAFIIAIALKPAVNLFSEKTSIDRNFSSLIIVIAFFAVVGLIGFFVIIQILGNSMTNMIEIIFEEAYKALESIRFYLGSLRYSDELMLYLEGMGSEISSLIISKLPAVAGAIPGICVGALIAVISTIFMEIEIEGIIRFIRKVAPAQLLAFIEESGGDVVRILKGCARSYALIFALTYAELLIGLLVMRIPGAFLIALIIALLDILPVLGTGAVLLPWSIIAFSTGRAAIGTGVLILYIVISVVRNVIEPKLVGHQIGLSPVVMLPCMLIGLKLFGIVGLIGLPILAAAASGFLIDPGNL